MATNRNSLLIVRKTIAAFTHIIGRTHCVIVAISEELFFATHTSQRKQNKKNQHQTYNPMCYNIGDTEPRRTNKKYMESGDAQRKLEDKSFWLSFAYRVRVSSSSIANPSNRLD